jgi:hypothetical protein
VFKGKIRLKKVNWCTKKDIAEIKRMLKALIKNLENKPLNPWTLSSNQIGVESIELTV